MDIAELSLVFSGGDRVSVFFEGTASGALEFSSPVTEKDRADIRWYVETYGAASLADPDDQEARRIEGRLPKIGKALFDAVFSERPAIEVFVKFRDKPAEQRVINVESQDASIQSLPWELLCDYRYLFREKPHVSVRRKIPGATRGRAPFAIKPKDQLRLLFVVSRPTGAGFIDPRADAQAVLDALEEYAPGRVTCEFLRPPTLNALVDRLNDWSKPIDILHFDGHGRFMQVSEEDAEKIPGFDRGTFHNILLRERQLRSAVTPDTPIGVGLLAFEKDDHTLDLVFAEKLGDNLFQSKVALVVLSACQTASLDADGDPMASVAGSLTSTGIPAILAMTHSVLVPTTRELFGEFYKSLANARSIATSLDDARTFLANNPDKYEVQRGPERKMLRLEDWFVPTLFEAGVDSPLLTKTDVPSKVESGKHNLRPRHEAGFVGRRRELWDIECWFADDTRRISITGFGGQGKTELAMEAGRWLNRVGMFQQAVFVDYAGVQSHDALAVAVSTISVVLEKTMAAADEVTALLAETPTLIILNNLETISEDSLHELLTAAAAWSQAGQSRVLLTSRRPDTGHPDYAIEGTFKHRRIQLEGLGSTGFPDDALDLFEQINLLPSAEPPQLPPPDLGDLIRLFDRVRFHPLSICVLVQLLKTRTAKQLEGPLEELLASDAVSPLAEEGTPKSLIASLQLSLERLSEDERRAVRRLGVFQGGTFEDDLLAITELAPDLWPRLRRSLEAAALIQAENVRGVAPPFLRFHPTLAPMLWASLEPAEQSALVVSHRRRYYKLVNFLYSEDRKKPDQVRAIARRELPNLLYGVQQALQAGDPDASDFVDSVNKFLIIFGLTREAATLTKQAEDAAGQRGSRGWYLTQSGRGAQLLDSGRAAEAAEIFSDILTTLGSEPSFNLATTLARVGRCHNAGGRPDLAETKFRQAIGVTEKLEQGDSAKNLRASLHADLGDVLAAQGKFDAARDKYERSLELKREVNDLRGQGVALGQLGSLAMREGDLADAVKRGQAALELFERLDEPAAQAVAHFQLGLALQRMNQWEQSELHYRESARLDLQRGAIAGAAQTWNQLAVLSQLADKPHAAETWYRKAIEGFRGVGDDISPAVAQQNLANLLATQPGRLSEARQLAEESLAIQKTLDPGAAEIWKSYEVLARIADQESHPEQAVEYRRLAREAKRNFAGTANEIKRHLPLILGTWQAVREPDKAIEFSATLSKREAHGWTNLVAAIRRILSGEREAESLCKKLDLEDSMIVETILDAIKDPSILMSLVPQGGAS